MIKYLIVKEKDTTKIEVSEDPETVVVSAADFIANTSGIDLRKNKHIKVINLCNSFDYLSKGYYVSLLAEARGLRAVPTISNIISLIWKRNYRTHLPELNQQLAKDYNAPPEEPVERKFLTFFGRHNLDTLEPLTRKIFDIFRFPALSFTLVLTPKKEWQLSHLEPVSIASLTDEQQISFQEALDKFTGTAWREKTKNKKVGKFWLAILHDPNEKLPPSNKAALKKFIKAGNNLGMNVELITKADYSSLLEYDALFIRETTAINHHTYRFALKAESEGIPCIDDTQSIIRCCNKVFLNELLQTKNVPIPHTLIIDRSSPLLDNPDISYPVVLKIPDGSFSRGMIKVKKAEDFKEAALTLLKKSEIILCQEFVSSQFDWRIGILNGEPLYASQYFMAEGHWQIYNHDAKYKKLKEGDAVTWDVSKVPGDVVEVALKAANLVGKGLYGVDLKQTDDKVVVMEVNDNPNIDHGVEDELLGDELYRKVLEVFYRS